MTQRDTAKGGRNGAKEKIPKLFDHRCKCDGRSDSREGMIARRSVHRNGSETRASRSQ